MTTAHATPLAMHAVPLAVHAVPLAVHAVPLAVHAVPLHKCESWQRVRRGRGACDPGADYCGSLPLVLVGKGEGWQVIRV